MTNRRTWIRRALIAGSVGIGAQQIWRHGHDYVFMDQFQVVEPGRIYRGAWQKPWPMKRLVRDYKIKTILALAHPADHYLSVQERAIARVGYPLGPHPDHRPARDERPHGGRRNLRSPR